MNTKEIQDRIAATKALRLVAAEMDLPEMVEHWTRALESLQAQLAR